MYNDIYAPSSYYEEPEYNDSDEIEAAYDAFQENEFERINEDIYDTNKDNNEVNT
jgi:hypothetical protein